MVLVAGLAFVAAPALADGADRLQLNREQMQVSVQTEDGVVEITSSAHCTSVQVPAKQGQELRSGNGHLVPV